MKVLAFAFMLLLAFPLCAERQPFERYQSVVDRQMFGQPPNGFDPTKDPSEVSARDARAQDQELTKEQEQVKSSVHFSVINVTPAGETAVGFTDNSDSKNPKHYYLKVGENRDGWTVKEADPLAATMTIAKGEIEVSLTLGGDSSRSGGTKRVASNSGSTAVPASGNRLASTGRSLSSLRERRALREAQRAADAKAMEEAKRAEAEKEAKREAEREAEKAEREREREEQRAQLLQIKEELRKAREEKVAEKDEAKSDEETGGGDES